MILYSLFSWRGDGKRQQNMHEITEAKNERPLAATAIQNVTPTI